MIGIIVEIRPTTGTEPAAIRAADDVRLSGRLNQLTRRRERINRIGIR
jgi:hypothetical protein